MSAPGNSPSLLTRAVLGFLLWVFRRQGWQVSGSVPASRRFVIVGAPHTSNWDFIFFLGATHELGIRPSFMGKDSLFKGALGRFMREMGGVPVVRSSSHNYVDQMIEQFRTREELMLVVAPEGTRGAITGWRSGFYHIALGANVPIVPAWVDVKRRIGALGDPIALTGDYPADLARIADFYRTVLPDHPKLAVLYREVEENARLRG